MLPLATAAAAAMHRRRLPACLPACLPASVCSTPVPRRLCLQTTVFTPTVPPPRAATAPTMLWTRSECLPGTRTVAFALNMHLEGLGRRGGGGGVCCCCCVQALTVCGAAACRRAAVCAAAAACRRVSARCLGSCVPDGCMRGGGALACLRQAATCPPQRPSPTPSPTPSSQLCPACSQEPAARRRGAAAVRRCERVWGGRGLADGASRSTAASRALT